VSAAFLLQGKKGRCDMKINVYYEDKNHPIELDVPDTQCEIWVEDDYQRRLSAAEDKTSVTRRTAQEIMDEDYNNPTFNNNQTETRRHVHLDALDPEDKHMSDGTDILADLIKKEGYERLYAAIRKLQTQQQELLRQIFWEGAKQKDIAERDGVSDRAITGRMKKIYAALKKSLS
jgi:RNA polymerase sigma factor (sigma-70 family)